MTQSTPTAGPGVQEQLPAAGPEAPSEGQAPPAPRRGADKARRRRWLLAACTGLLLLGGFISWSATRPPQIPPGPVIADTGGAIMRGEVRPARRATLAAISAGTVEALFAAPGQTLDSKEPVARVQGPAGAELVVAPWRGTVTTIPVHVGDTLMPGATVATMADLSQMQVETVDVDEFQVARLQPGQTVRLTIDALDETIPGRIRSVALEPQVSSTGDSNYLVIIDPSGRLPGLRSGMTVRVRGGE